MGDKLQAILYLGIAIALGAEPRSLYAQTPRSVYPLADGWRFHQGETTDKVELPDFDDSAWESVSVPHSWNRVGYYLSNPQTHIHQADMVNKAQEQGWYRLVITPDETLRGKRAWLEFDGASRVASVWLNGVHLGEHRGGFSRFRFDATAALRPGQSNHLVVRADNSLPFPGAATADTLPLAGDFFVHGGLYRPVSLIVTNPVHIDMLDMGGPGVYAHTERIDETHATIAVRSRLRNDDDQSAHVTVAAFLLDAEGEVVALNRQTVALTAGAGTDVEQQIVVADPRLWQGVADPYLYRLRVDVAAADGGLLDQIEQTFGIRQMRFDPQQGFFLNGEKLSLRGVGYHQDREGKGWAVSPDDIAEDMAIMREMGVNTIRLTHYQHGQTIHDLADRYGIILWDEIPLVTVWTNRGSLEPTDRLRANARLQLQELIRQNYNHASVATWGIANEVDFGNSFPSFLTGYKEGEAPDPMPLLQELDELAKQEDATRPTALATCCEGRMFAPGVNVPITAEAADLGGANRYFGWYFGEVEDLDDHLDALHAARPRQPLSITEYGAGGATTIHTDNVLGGPIDSRGRIQPEAYESYIHERSWAILSRKPYLWATWLWNAFDFATTIRAEGDAQDINTKGLVTYDRAIRKDAYFFYKANWTDTPTVHITDRRYRDRAYPVTNIRVYSNASETKASLNGRLLGARRDCPDRICEWKNVKLAAGANRLKVVGRFKNDVIEDEIEWRLSDDAARNIRIDSGAIVAGGRNFGSDNFFDGGQAGTLDEPADYGKPAVKAEIGGTDADSVAATFREGRFAYRVPLSKGRYALTFTFVEPSKGPDERIFSVTANGEAVITRLDVAKIAGGAGQALIRQAVVNVRGGMLDLDFIPEQGDAIVSALEISPSGQDR